MFDIGFTELLLCLVVALVVIGPEQLPGTVRTVALWIGRLKRGLAETRTEIERQIGADDIRRQLYNEEIMRNVEETRLQLEASLREHAEAASTAPDQTPSAADYGPPEELPDHAHGADQDKTAQPNSNSINQTKPVTPVSSGTNSPAAAQHSHQQHSTTAATPPTATPDGVNQVAEEPKARSGQQVG